ncbi:MAG TPA: hypothetical protein VLS89_19215, partial [Candidatus Nanopelagicales bacterium]|nr:hypothetical protein [Candidatus Nanopelagicales bacterium]
MSWIDPEPEARSVAPGVALRLPRHADAREEPEGALPAVDLSAIAGARVVVRLGLTGPEGVRVRALCAAAPADRWAPGAEELVLDRANALARPGAPGEVTRWDAGPIRELIATAGAKGGFEQRFEGVARAGDGTLAVRGRHLLGFTDEPAALLCTALCAEPAVDAAAAPRCDPVIHAVTLEGALAPPPPPGLLVRGL